MLIRHGQDSLFYYPNGKLMKVKPIDYFFCDYSYSTPDQNGNSTIKSTTYYKGNVARSFQYDLDKNGRCILFHDYNSGFSPIAYEYSADGRLKKSDTAAYPNGGRVEYVYDANGELIREEQYGGK